jgi:hypothetical protein
MTRGVHKNPYGTYIRGPSLSRDLRRQAADAAAGLGYSGLSEPTIAFWRLLATDPRAARRILAQIGEALGKEGQP